MGDDIDAAKHGAFDEGWAAGFRAGAEAMRERAAARADREPEPECEVPPAVAEQMRRAPEVVVRAGVIATKRGIAAAIRALPVLEGE